MRMLTTLVFAALVGIAEPVQARENASCSQAVRNLRPVMSPLVADGLVSFTSDRIYVAELLWHMLDAQEKENLTKSLIIYQECRNNLSKGTITGTGAVYGKQSGARLARITLFRGFQIG